MSRRVLSCLFALTTSLAFAAGCDGVEQEVEDDGAVFLRPGSGGIWLNTSAIDAHMFAALDLKKGKHDGVRLDRVVVKQGNKFITVDNVKAVDGEIQAGQGSTSFFGQQLVGSKWELTLVAGAVETPATMWIASAVNSQGAWRYSFEHLDAQGNVATLCEPDADGSTTAVPIDDITVNAATGDVITRANTLYLACTSGAVGKAVTWGYTPWDITVDDFEASVRVVRADYCGNGQSWTTPGQPVQLQDAWGVNTFANASASTEAVWGINGARCLNQARLAGQGPVTCGGVAVPACASNVSLSTPGALVWSKNTL